jgi:hypothetical protein
MELRIERRGGKAVLGEEVGIVQIDGLVIGLTGGIDIDDFDVFAHGSRFQRLPGHGVDALIDEGRFEFGGEAGVERISAEPAVRRGMGGASGLAGHRLVKVNGFRDGDSAGASDPR